MMRHKMRPVKLLVSEGILSETGQGYAGHKGRGYERADRGDDAETAAYPS